MKLAASDVTVRFAGIRAIENVSLELSSGDILGLVGPNGAGKTTMVNVLSGFQRPHGGNVAVEGLDARGRSEAWFARNGVVRTFQAVRLFRGLSVSENIEAALSSLGIGRLAARRRAAELLDYLGMAEKRNAPADSLNYSDERRLGIARALGLNPRFLLLDEPAAGMNVAEAEVLSGLIKRIRADFSCGILLIEHNMTLIRATCERLHVMASGRTMTTGAPDAVMADESFRSAYLGSAAA
ncbi:MAG: ABC transporter ATP-binding protein [Mesorhizobium amorphae]|nr:MAG: ABC transporter ATP-binding protein [Mesorhizobium amorphae]